MITIGLTTTPRRVNYLLPTIESLLRQTQQADRIIVAVPRICARLGEEMGELPRFLVDMAADDRRIEIILCPDYGPATKIVVPKSLTRQGWLIWLDDDICYGKHMVEQLVSNCPPQSAIATSGFLWQGIRPVNAHLASADILEAWGGICCRVEDLPDLDDLWQPKTAEDYHRMSLLEKCHWQADDYVMSRALQDEGIGTVVCSTLKHNRSSNHIRKLGLGDDGLQKCKETGGNIYAYMRLDKQRRKFKPFKTSCQ
jgi:hypothetical protein